MSGNIALDNHYMTIFFFLYITKVYFLTKNSLKFYDIEYFPVRNLFKIIWTVYSERKQGLNFLICTKKISHRKSN